jgi:hypothetical protein
MHHPGCNGFGRLKLLRPKNSQVIPSLYSISGKTESRIFVISRESFSWRLEKEPDLYDQVIEKFTAVGRTACLLFK